MTPETTTKYRGRNLEEILPRIRAELGDDAVVVGRRDVLEGGVGGFFARKEIEVEARPARPRLDIREDEPAEPDSFAAHLEAVLPPAPEVTPFVAPQVSAQPTIEDVLPEPRLDLAKLFAAAPVVEPEEEPEPVAVEPEPAVVEPEPVAVEPEPVAEVLPAAPEPVADPRPLPVAAAPTAETGDLVAHGLSPQLAAEVRDEAVNHLMPLAASPQLEPLLREALARRIPIATPRRGPEGGVVGFVGPGGSGKTRCVARMAKAYATRSEKPVAVVTLRPKDGGAELQRLLAPVGVAIHAEEDAAAAAARIDLLREHALVLLDTPALSPRAEAERRVLAAELRQLRADELHVCVPATIAPGAGRTLVAAARELGADAMAITHADETEELGVAVELAIDTGLPVSLLGRGTSLEAGLRAAAADDLALALVP